MVVAGTPTIRAFLEFPAGQSDLPKKMRFYHHNRKGNLLHGAHYEVNSRQNIIGWLLKTSLSSGIRPPPPINSWDLDTNLLRTRGNSAANQKSYTVPGKLDAQACRIGKK